MERLNIPLSRHIATTRRQRRVVWLLGTAWLFVILAGWMTARWYALHDNITHIIPDETVAIARFKANKYTWPAVQSLLGNIPLISERALTTDDIAQFLQGEFAIFFMQDGSRALAVRASHDDLPLDLLDASGIVVSEGSEGTWILSDRLLPISSRAWKPKHSFFHGFGGIMIGNILVADERPVSGTIVARRHGLTIHFPGKINAKSLKKVPKTAFASLSTSALPKNTIQPLADAIDMILLDSSIATASWLSNKIVEKTDGFAILTMDNEEFGYLFRVPDTDQLLGRDLLKILAAIHSPTTREWMLPDQSRVKELIIDTSLIVIEESVNSGTPILRSRAGSNDFFAFQDGMDFILTNQASLVEFWLNKSENQHACGTSIVYADLAIFSDIFTSKAIFATLDPFQLLSERYSSIFLRNKWIGTKVELCNGCCG